MGERWRNAAVRTDIEWPIERYKVVFDSNEFELRPANGMYAPDVVLRFDDSSVTDIESHKLVREFLSVLVWLKRQPLYEFCSGVSSHCLPQNGPGPQFQNVSDDFQVQFIPDLSHPKAKVALAIYREATNVNSTPYKFLGYWKLISLLFKDGDNQQIDWLVDTIPKLNDDRATRQCNQLKSSLSLEEIVRNRLYGARRCAVAHATSSTVNPDDPAEEKDFASDLYIVKALAEYIIEFELGIKSEKTLYKEHSLALPVRGNKCKVSYGQMQEFLKLSSADDRD